MSIVRERRWRWGLGLVVVGLLDAVGTARADEEEPSGPPGIEEEGAPAEPARKPEAPKAIDDEAAKPLLEALKKVEKKKDAKPILDALEAIAEVHNPEFEKSLLKLMGHESSLVAMRAATLWEGRIADDKVADRVWKSSWLDKRNERRFGVKARALRAMGTAGVALDKKQFDEVERDWRWMVGNPDESHAEALTDICAYFEATKDKRLCRRLAEELDEPVATAPNSPTNPPAEWWERRHKTWRAMKPAVVSALKAITGQEFDKTEQAKAWFEANRKSFGFDW
jgi:hypothetical protein